MKNTNKYEVILTVVKHGFTEAVIDAARNAGASGGTVLSGRGNSKKKAQNNYGLMMTEDKDIIMILSTKEAKTKIMNAIYKVSGIETEGKAIIFTLPADNVVGLRKEK